MNRIWEDLRSASADRQRKWDPDNRIDLDWRVNELAGEAGEVCNLLKKWDRELAGLPGSRTTPEAILEELADVVICCDLVMLTAGLSQDFDMLWQNVAVRSHAPLARYGIQLMAAVGRVCEFHLDNVRQQDFQSAVRDAGWAVKSIANAFPQHGLAVATSRKFNKTSHTVGLPVFLDIDGRIKISGKDPMYA